MSQRISINDLTFKTLEVKIDVTPLYKVIDDFIAKSKSMNCLEIISEILSILKIPTEKDLEDYVRGLDDLVFRKLVTRIIVDEETLNQPNVLTVSDISCLIIPVRCLGLPTLAALEQGIPVIAVKENKNRMINNLEELPFAPGKLFVVENYLEAVGVIHALRSGVSLESVRRPIPQTKIEEIPSKDKIPTSVKEQKKDAVSKER